jgi:hypothetical protein
MPSVSGFIGGSNVSEAWLNATEFLLSVGGDATNLCVTVQDPSIEDSGIRGCLDSFLESRRREQRSGQRVEKVSTVANTIFPQHLYRPALGDQAMQHLFMLAGEARPLSRRRNRSDTYFDRLWYWPQEPVGFNQLERAVLRLRSEHRRGRESGNAYELGFVNVGGTDDETFVVYGPGLDNRTIGFPCLSHVSLSLNQGRIHMAALYRNHQFMRRAYGNYVGLARLLAFIVRESGWQLGELMCVSSHATAEVGSGRGFGRSSLAQLIRGCGEVASVSLVSICHWDDAARAHVNAEESV